MKRLLQRKLLGQRVRALRRRAGMSQEQLAEAAMLFRTYVVRIESGAADPTVSVLLRVADALGVSIDVLFETAPPSDNGTGAAPVLEQAP